MYIYYIVYVYICVCVCVCVYIYIYIWQAGPRLPGPALPAHMVDTSQVSTC